MLSEEDLRRIEEGSPAPVGETVLLSIMGLSVIGLLLFIVFMVLA